MWVTETARKTNHTHTHTPKQKPAMFIITTEAVADTDTYIQQNKALCGSWAPYRAGRTEYGVTIDDVENV